MKCVCATSSRVRSQVDVPEFLRPEATKPIAVNRQHMQLASVVAQGCSLNAQQQGWANR